jgi:hypothetical protein
MTKWQPISLSIGRADFPGKGAAWFPVAVLRSQLERAVAHFIADCRESRKRRCDRNLGIRWFGFEAADDTLSENSTLG